MAKNYNMYNYETSPRKIQPEYIPKTKQKTNKNVRANEHEKLKKKLEEKKLQEQKRKKQQRKLILYICIGFTILFAVSYRNSQIDETFSQVQKLQKDLANIEKENEQLKVNIESGSNLNSLEQSAKELLGMQKLSNKQSVYVSLPKVDYIEGAQKEETNKESFLESITKNLLNIF